MPYQKSDEFGARFHGTNNFLALHDHFFPAANTGLAKIPGDEASVKRHEATSRTASGWTFSASRPEGPLMDR